ncbi:MAG: hypothetical protein K0R55_169 [Sporomusa sp.]|jgi:uncharacterized membrane protein (UPF0127 family)|nr:hypothetical protein [Sporomusa sp.]
MQVFNKTRHQRLGDNIKIAGNFFTRLIGLLATAHLPTGAGLLIKPCSSVHTFGMRYPIDVVFVDSSHTVIKVVSGLRPCRWAVAGGAAYVIELPAGMVRSTYTQAGDRIELLSRAL